MICGIILTVVQKKEKKKDMNKERSWRNSGFFLYIILFRSIMNGFFVSYETSPLPYSSN